MKKVALFAFNGNPMCFIHVLLNGIGFRENGYIVKIIIEGEATKLIPEFFNNKSMIYNLVTKAIDNGIIEGVCEACSKKMNTYDIAKNNGLNILNDIMGHPSMEKYVSDGFSIITF